MKIFIKLSEFERKYLNSLKYISVIPVEVMVEYNKAFVSNSQYMQVDSHFEVDLLNAYAERLKNDGLRKRVGELASQGHSFEKSGNIDDAIDCYIECINVGETGAAHLFYGYAHSYERLFILLHKANRKNDEIEYLRRYLSHKEVSDKSRDKYNKRLQKLLA